jgi:hypothetical protein
VLKKLKEDDELKKAMANEIEVIKKVLGAFSLSYTIAVGVGLYIVLVNSETNFIVLRKKFCDDDRGWVSLGSFFYLLF